MDDITDAPTSEGGLSPEQSPDHTLLLKRVMAKLKHELICYDPRLHDDIAAALKGR